LLLKLEIHAATDIAEIEPIKLQRHVILVDIDQVERGIVEVLIHSIEVKGRRLETLIEGYEPVADIGSGDLGRKRYAGKGAWRESHIGSNAEGTNVGATCVPRAEYRCGA